MRSIFCGLLVACAALLASESRAAVVVSYWNQNSNALPGGGFGFLADPDVFPQQADIGNGTLTVGGGLFNDTTVNGNGDTVYQWIQSFAGSTVNAQPGDLSGGSIAPQGGTENGNNGGYFEFEFSMAGLNSLDISYATRRTSTGFVTQTWSHSSDGVSFVDFWTVDGITTSSTLETRFFPGLTALDGESNAFLRVTFDGATAATGNNRLDNITFTAVPEPSSLAVLGLIGAGGWASRRFRRNQVADVSEETVI